MYKTQVRLLKCGCMINDNENEGENEKQIEQIQHEWIQAVTGIQIYKYSKFDAAIWLYVLSNTEAPSEAQFMKKLSKTEAELKKSVAQEKKKFVKDFYFNDQKVFIFTMSVKLSVVLLLMNPLCSSRFATRFIQVCFLKYFKCLSFI